MDMEGKRGDEGGEDEGRMEEEDVQGGRGGGIGDYRNGGPNSSSSSSSSSSSGSTTPVGLVHSPLLSFPLSCLCLSLLSNV